MAEPSPQGVPDELARAKAEIAKLESELSDARLQSERSLQADILACTDDAVIALDDNQRIRFFNAAAAGMFCLQAPTVSSTPLSGSLCKLFGFPDKESLAAAAERQRTWRTESRQIRDDGVELIVSATISKLPMESGSGLVAFIRDITESKRAEVRLQQETTQLALANEDLLHFAYAVGHDLKAPLRTVTSFAQLLSLRYKSKLDNQGGEFIRRIVDASSRMDTMLHDLLEFAKVAGSETEPAKIVPLARALSTAVESLRSSIEETHAVISSDPLPEIAGDEGQFTQLFENLLGNSIKYRRNDLPPAIYISAQQSDAHFVITIKDNGIGFKPEHAEEIFGVFKRLHKDEFSGTGIGLSICKRIVERRGGKIWATSEPEQGASFSFSIPLEVSTQTSSIGFNVDEQQDQTSLQGHFDELFQTLALAPAVVRELDGTISIWTRGSESLFGWSESEVVGKHLRELIKAEITQSELEIEAELLRTGEWRGELKATKRDGSIVWLVTHKILYRDGSGRPRSVIEVHNDVTALKEAQAALVQSSEQRDLALRAGQMGLWSWDRRTGAVTWSHTLESLLGMPPGSFEGTYEAFEKRLHPDDRQALKDHIERAFKAEQPAYAIENRLLRNDGTYRWVRGQGTVLFNEHREPVGLVGALTDITERKQRDADQQFLLDLSTRLTDSSVQTDFTRLVLKELATYLGASRSIYTLMDLDARVIHNLYAYHTNGPPAEGLLDLGDFEQLALALSRGEPLLVENLETDYRTASTFEKAYLPYGTRSFLALPVLRSGIWVATLSVSAETARKWQEREIDLVAAVAERLFPAIENAQLLQEIREQKEFFENTFEKAAVGLAHVAPDGRLLRINSTFCNITGYSKEELAASRFQDIIALENSGTDHEALAALKLGDAPSYSTEKRYFNKSGTEAWVNLTISLVREPTGEPSYAISVIEDITERKKTAFALEATNKLAQLRLSEIEAIYSQAPVGLMFLDRDLQVVRVNRYLATICVDPNVDLSARKVSELLRELGVCSETKLQKVLDTREPFIEMEVTLSSFDPKHTGQTLLVSYFPVEGPDGSVLGINGVVQDITVRTQQEKESLRAAERLRIATYTAQLGVFTWNSADDSVIWENDRMYEITGRNKSAGPINNLEFVRNLLHPDDADDYLKALNDAMSSGGAFRHSCRFRRSDGQLRWAEFSGQFSNASANSSSLIGVMADVTERVETEAASRHRKQFLRSVLDSLFTFVGVLDLDGVLLEANKAPLEAGGLKAEDVIGKPFAETYWWSYSSEVQDVIRRVIKNAAAGEAARFDVPVLMRNAQLVTIDFMIAPLRDESGEIRYVIPSAVPIDQRKQTEEALRQSEERYRLAEWAINDGLWDWNPITDACYFSPNLKSLLGHEEHELESTGAAIFAKLHPDSKDVLFEALRLNFSEKKPYDVEAQLRLKNGAYRWFRTRGESVRDHSGQVMRMIGAITDIHDRKLAEGLSREHDEQLRQLINSMEQLAWMAHADGSSYWYNRRWYEYTGTTPEQMQGWGWQAVHDPDILPRVMDRWLRSIQTGTPFEMEFPIRGANGIFQWFLTRIVPVRDSEGNLVKWFGSNTNIESIRREQDVLKRSERQFRELAETLPDHLWVSNAHGQITYWNPQLYAYTGYSDGDGLADRWLSMVHPDDAPNLFRVWQQSVAEGRHHEYESRMRRSDGTYRWFLNRAKPVKDDSGNIVKWLGTSTDIHQQKMTEEALRRSNEDLEQFAYAASHDLQEPLRTISIYSQLLARKFKGAGPDADRFVDYIVHGTARMESLLKGILAYSRVGDPLQGSFTCESEAVFRDALNNLSKVIQESKADVTFDSLPSLACPETHVLQLFQHLLGNAIKYRSQRPPKIHVSAARQGRFHRFSISDNGIGIKAEYAEKIFGMFKRLHRDEYPGIGVGLAISKRIAERHGGRIWVESETDQGSVFYFTLPAVE